jgi:two-component system LytT family response regulator
VIRVLIVDDEPLARRGIRKRLQAHAEVEVAGECESAEDAIEAIRALRPDLVFLDIQMPGASGFAVIERADVEPMPIFVFVTAYDAHAIRAFEANALDYLLKPIDDDRFARAVERAVAAVRDRHAVAEASEWRARLLSLVGGGAAPRAETPPSAPRPQRIPVRDAGRIILIDPDDVDWIAAEGDYVRLHCGARGYLIREGISALEARLAGTRLVRIHRSTIVNVDRGRELRPRENQDFTVLLANGASLRLSRTYREAFERAAGYALDR